MVETLSPPDTSLPRPPSRRRRVLAVVLAIAAALAVTVAALVARDLRESSFSVPTFPSLADHPDPSLHGTVAFFEGRSRCVWIVAAAGQPSEQVLCLPPMDIAKAVQLGAKETDPQLVWLPDGRLQVTVFRAAMAKGRPPTLTAGWQKVVDVRSRDVEEIPATGAPSTPDLSTRPTSTPDGRRITTSTDPSSGRIKVMLTDTNGTRTLLAAHGPGMYSYDLHAAFWAPNWQWIAADDGRILLITPGDPPVTRVLTDRASQGGGATVDGGFSTFAVTAADLLTPSD
jgi:hypothetical protein